MTIDGYKIQPVKVTVAEMKQSPRNETTILQMELYEGRNRQIRKMCESVGVEILRLTRVAIGNVTLGNLKSGDFRHLTRSQVEYLKNC